MTDNMKNDLFYVCALIEYIARQTSNKRAVIVNTLGEDGITKQLSDAEVNHCLSFEQVCDEIVEQYSIPHGSFDTTTSCKYDVPSYLDIGKLYSIIIADCAEVDGIVKEIISVFSSFISDEISDFATDLYYQNPSYLECSYKAGYLLD